ncbi:MAG: hypothetical protein KDB03_27070, partial [Planctomycetales bacterium]|nr:hypothetical protein [Planctomycetales bacterium]
NPSLTFRIGTFIPAARLIQPSTTPDSVDSPNTLVELARCVASQDGKLVMRGDRATTMFVKSR